MDLVGEGFDAAIRIAALPDSSLVARRPCEMSRHLVGSPAYLNRRGRQKHPLHLTEHRCIGHGYTMSPETWYFAKDCKSETVRPAGPPRVNNGDAIMPALIAGIGLGHRAELAQAEQMLLTPKVVADPKRNMTIVSLAGRRPKLLISLVPGERFELPTNGLQKQ